MMEIKQALEIIAKKLAESRVGPLGTIEFKLYSKDMSNEAVSGGVILEAASGAQVFRLEREAQPKLSFYHWSPGTGARCATIDLSDMEPAEQWQVGFSWSPPEIGLFIQPLGQPEEAGRFAKGTHSKKQFRVTQTGGIVQIGDHGVDILAPKVFEGGKLVLGPTALESWKLATTAAEILLKAKSEDGFMFEVVRANSVLSGLVTGLESFLKKRITEIESEGIGPDLDGFHKAAYRKSQLTSDFLSQLQLEANESDMTVIQYVVENENQINFQDFEKAKVTFNKTYGIKFGEIGLSGNEIDRLRTLLKYRHRISHVSPMVTILNEPLGKGEDPEFANDALARNAIAVFSAFVTHLHEATLELRGESAS